ncbi:MAG: hypothetical protein CO186_08455 [Zetaproteobacteria bacterium CG_4_9_14_3_um_filter_49_83]|nr:MAG: hypothetical protein AUJ56_13470 [Zetaproteobacteria bacterium CG1_02_49_23]PIQ31340.1 MAG: hypothetical protein COW62_10070 [Zetaproteobacteria bacterium CG17_big_fil_post_rev_8_21_14_2_50_50_13]PIV31679.1 MAG: hypothetical protein COS35_00110 [Zetaproteobacteria bacterium CG02_land_8_20_14_3_00_50_9]PIY55370.1 MAG: hypothetical protein COZ00_09825 [Zetaproteobacteria bacterium CG_4_10_14_0_8_um_filter_49_80]PJA34938.1 MAG: hypothetical protein CO186_08455 [Zetaproteobacteria bacterium
MSVERDMIEKMRKIEALFARAGTEGERMAAESALERMKMRIEACKQADPAVEYKFSLNNTWSRRLLIALLRRYDIEPYRRYRQRRTTVMAKVSRSFVDQTLWPEFTALNEALQAHLDAITSSIISQAIFADSDDVEEVQAIEG